MNVKVCIAEKPSVAKEIANVIGARSRKDGYFEGNGYQVTWTFGHFCTLFPPEDYNPSWKRWDLNTLPMLPDKFETKLKSDSGIKKQFGIVKKLFKRASVVINCGDAGTEGELIQRWVIKQANYKGKVQRLWISSLTTASIKKGFDDLRDGDTYNNLFYAASSRAIGDWLLGMNATRLYTLKYGGYKQVLSIGRVQTPTLAMLVKRHHEIENFVSTPYWELSTLYREVEFKYEGGKFEVKENAETLLHRLTGKELTIIAVEKKDGKEYAPKLYDLTSLQVHCNNKYGYSADHTLKLVQRLYEMKVVSYPRVDTCYLPNDLYPQIPSILKGLSNYANPTANLLDKKIRKSSNVFNDKKVTDHHAIIPTGEEKNLGRDEQQVYDMIVRRFLAVFYPDCKVAKTKVSGQVEEIIFHVSGKEIIDQGWRVLFPKKEKKKEDGKKESEVILPQFNVGEKGPQELSLKEKMTKAPPYYTEATLLRAMETAGKQVDDDELRELMKENGIGRPSTRAAIIETLFRRKYTQRRKKQVLPTQVGIDLIGAINNDLLKSAELTGTWEKKLKEIEHGRHNPKSFISEMKKLVEELVTEVRLEKKSMTIAAPVSIYSKSKSARKGRSSKTSTSRKMTAKSAKPKKSADPICPKCNKGKIVKGRSSYGCTNYQSGCDMRLPFKFMGKTISATQLAKLCSTKKSSALKGFMKDGNKVDGTMVLHNDFSISLKEAYKVGAPTKVAPRGTGAPHCPRCKKGTLVKGKQAYGCSRWKEGCDFTYSYEKIRQQANGRKLTREMVLELIKD